MPTLILIAAIAANRAIGRDNQLLWKIPEDMAHFKTTTQGHTVLMGRKTWASLPPPFRPLPGRRNLVLSRQQDFLAPGAEVVASLPAALARLADTETVFVIGGAEIYAQAMPLADELMLTEVADSPSGDAYFPEISLDEWQEKSRQPPQTVNGLAYSFVSYQRKPK